jgi:hypothetical protein
MRWGLGSLHIRGISVTARRLKLPASWVRLPITLGSVLLATALVCAEEAKPDFQADAVPVQQSHGYLRSHDAPHYWALSPYYLPQFTDSACSVATIAMLVNAVRITGPTELLVTQRSLLEKVGSDQWKKETIEGGDGVTWDEFVGYTRTALATYGIAADVEVFKPGDNSPATLAKLRQVLSESEASERDILLIYFDQGVLTGDWDGPHTSPVAAYDGEQRRVLIMDVDRESYVPYWSSDEKLLEAMLRPAPASMGVLTGQTGGLVWVKIRSVN